MSRRKIPKLPGGVTAEWIVETARRHGAFNVRLFGSWSRAEPKEESDLDLLVDFEAGRNLFDLINLKHELETQVGRRVDVLTERALSPYIREAVLRESVPL